MIFAKRIAIAVVVGIIVLFLTNDSEHILSTLLPQNALARAKDSTTAWVNTPHENLDYGPQTLCSQTNWTAGLW